MSTTHAVFMLVAIAVVWFVAGFAAAVFFGAFARRGSGKEYGNPLPMLTWLRRAKRMAEKAK